MDFAILNTIIVEETEVLNKLLELLEKQHALLVKNDVMLLHEIVESIKICNREVAEKEVQRRNFLKAGSMKDAVVASENYELNKNYRNIKKLLSEIEVQKDCNEMLIKMGMAFSTRMLQIINPNAGNKIYNNYGRIKP